MVFFRWFKKFFIPHRDNAYRPHLLRRRWLVFLLVVVLAAEVLLVANLLAREAGNSFMAAVIQSEIISLTNTARADSNLAALTENTRLTAAAQAKADDMAVLGYFSHVGPDGREPWAWIDASGYDYQYAGENLAVRFVDSKDVINGWMASPTHRANIVGAAYSEVGVGIAQGLYKGEPATFVVQYFGTPSITVEYIAPTVQQVVSASAPAPVAAVLGAETVVPTSATFSNTLARQLGRLVSEPRSTTAFVLGGIIILLMLSLTFAFFHHVQIQARDLLVPGTLVVSIALTLLFINNNLLQSVIPDNQAASVVNVILSP